MGWPPLLVEVTGWRAMSAPEIRSEITGQRSGIRIGDQGSVVRDRRSEIDQRQKDKSLTSAKQPGGCWREARFGQGKCDERVRFRVEW